MKNPLRWLTLFTEPSSIALMPLFLSGHCLELWPGLPQPQHFLSAIATGGLGHTRASCSSPQLGHFLGRLCISVLLGAVDVRVVVLVAGDALVPVCGLLPFIFWKAAMSSSVFVTFSKRLMSLESTPSGSLQLSAGDSSSTPWMGRPGLWMANSRAD